MINGKLAADLTLGSWSNREVSLIFVDHAREQWKKDDPEGALKALQRAVLCEPANPQLFLLRGLILMQMERNADARLNIRHALVLGGTQWFSAGLVRANLKILESRVK